MKRILVSTVCSLVLAVGGYFLSGLLTAPARGDNGTPPTGQFTICHATGSSSNPYVVEHPDASGIVDGHADHQYDEDIIPAFDYTNSQGVTKTYPGQNLGPLSQFGGVTGADILANGCTIPTQGTPTVTVVNGQTVTVTQPAVTVQVPGETPPANVVTQERVVTQTVTTPGQTVVQTVTLPPQVVTQVQTVQAPPQTITVQGPTRTVTVTKTRTILKAGAHKTKRAKKKAKPHFTG